MKRDWFPLFVLKWLPPFLGFLVLIAASTALRVIGELVAPYMLPSTMMEYIINPNTNSAAKFFVYLGEGALSIFVAFIITVLVFIMFSFAYLIAESIGNFFLGRKI
jgi:hypothetical protein